MKFLLKLFCLLSLLSSFAFSSNTLIGFDDDNFPAGDLTADDVEFFDNYRYAKYKPNNEFYYILSLKPSSWGDLYYFGKKRKPGVYGSFSGYGAYLIIENISFSGRYAYSYNNVSYYEFTEEERNAVISYNPIKYVSAEILLSCPAGTNFGINSKKCYPACSAGESWDYKNEVCYSDCTDKNLNKFGYSNGTSQGGCVDCSNALANREIASCVCAGFGSALPDSIVFVNNPDSPFVSTICADGSSITFKKRSNENADKDKDKKKDNNSTNSSDKDKDNPNPDKKDNNENSNNSSGESGNSSNNNSGGSSGNGSSGGGGTGVETKPNPNNGNGKQDGKGDGKQDGKGEEGKGDDNIRPANLDYEGLKASVETFEGQFKTAVDDSFSFVNDVKASLTDTIQKIKDGNLMSLKKGAVPTSCPLSFDVNFVFSNKQITFDLCKVFSSFSSSLYILFYLGFFILFLVVVIKLFILTFMGW